MGVFSWIESKASDAWDFVTDDLPDWIEETAEDTWDFVTEDQPWILPAAAAAGGLWLLGGTSGITKGASWVANKLGIGGTAAGAGAVAGAGELTKFGLTPEKVSAIESSLDDYFPDGGATGILGKIGDAATGIGGTAIDATGNILGAAGNVVGSIFSLGGTLGLNKDTLEALLPALISGGTSLYLGDKAQDAAQDAAQVESDNYLKAAQIQADASKEGAQITADAYREGQQIASDTTLEMYYQSRDDTAPWREAGAEALTKQQALVDQGPGEFKESPGYQFVKEEGTKAMTNALSARGRVISGPRAKAVGKYVTGLASQEYGNFWNRYVDKVNMYAGIAGTGQTAAQGAANAAIQTGANLSNIQQTGIHGVGNALSGGIYGAANAQAGGLRASGNVLSTGILNANNAWSAGVQGVATAANQFLANIYSRQTA